MSVSPKENDVFISFRGEDTRTNFTSHLYDALCRRNIESYIDYELEKGDEISPALIQAIQESHISIVIFSENYATSKWCLDELLKILECKELRGQVVIPVFHNIDPSDVRKQKGGYERAFAKYERELKNNKSLEDKVSQWKAALTVAANISGWDSRTHRDDSQVIENIVNDVLEKLSQLYPNELKDILHPDENSEYIESLLERYPRIGIWGMPGIGKTTIARHTFAKHFAQYDGVCFLENVSEESKRFGQTYVRNKLLGELLKRQITASDHGSTFIKKRLSGKKVFIVLDDVDSAMQLEYLCGDLDNLGPNSRLIITTRDRHTLSGKVDEIYEVTKWKLEESLKLFCLGAFKQSHPREGYERLSERAVAYAGGIPLALKVLGSHFRSRNTKFWESELNDLENKEESVGEREIQKVLKVGYNGLTQREKEIFLDIAFFFEGENKDFITRILDAFGFKATSGVEILEDKAHITISNSNRIQMHDLLQKMAFNLVREESRDPGRRSRLKDANEIRDVLENKKGTDAIEGIMFDLSLKVDLHVRADTFNLMTKLRFLKFYIPSGKKRSGTVYHPKVIKPFFGKLTYLEWDGYPMKSLPQPFRAEQLVEIRLPHSDIEHLWYGMQELVNLEGIDLSECKELVNLPDLSGALKLKWMYLSGCESLCEVQPSAFSKDTLVTLLLDRCTKLQSLVSEKHLTSLKNVNVNGCISLKEFSLSSNSIGSLDLSNTGTEILHPSIGGMNNLWWLNLEGLRLQNLPNELSRLRSLTELRLSSCSVVTKSKLEALFDGLQSLTLLYLKHCCKLFELPGNISSLSLLYELGLDGSNVERLPTSIKYLSGLVILSLDNCEKLSCLPELPPNIKEIHADNCTSLVTVSTLKTFSVSMIGRKKYISFKNGLMRELDGPSLDCITEDAILMMKSAAFHNILVRNYRSQTHSCNYNSAEVCLPGCGVPRQFKLGTTTGSSTITIDISNSLVGFIFAVVVSPTDGTKQHGNRAIIQCQCYSEYGRMVGIASRWHRKAITNLNMDHVFVWYDPYHSDSIFSSYERKISFEFCVTTYPGGELDDGLFSINECGLCPIYYSEIPRLLGTMNLDEDLKSELYDAIQLESRSVGSYDEEGEGDDIESIEIIGDEKESTSGICTQIQNQELDLNDKLHRSYDSLIVSKGSQAYDNPREKEKWDDDDNSKEMEISKILHKSSTKSREEIETSSYKQEQSEDVESSFKKAMKSDESSSDDESYPYISPIRLKRKYSAMKKAHSLTEKWKKDEETEDEENAPVDLGKPEGEEDDGSSDEDPFAELESILLGSPESSATATCSTSDIREALYNLECLLENSLESILGDVELQRQLHVSLECIKQASHEEVSPNVAKLVESMTSSIEDLFNDFASTKKVVEDHIVCSQHKEKLVQRVSDAKKQRESMKKEKSWCEGEAERLEEEGKKLDENIRVLAEQKKNVELKKAKLKESMERCEGEKKKLKVEAKNMITESKELMSAIKNSKSSHDAALSKQQRLNDKWESFKTAFADNWECTDDLYGRPSMKVIPLIEQFPYQIHEYIENIVNVDSDGNCGYRSIAVLLGMGEESWSIIRQDLITELTHNHDLYVKPLGGIDEVTKLKRSLFFPHRDVRYENWMTIPDAGYVIATRYNVVLVCISLQGSYTIFPLQRAPPPDRISHRVISIGYIERLKHFVPIYLNDGSPIPRSDRIWQLCRSDEASGWETPYFSRMQYWR